MAEYSEASIIASHPIGTALLDGFHHHFKDVIEDSGIDESQDVSQQVAQVLENPSDGKNQNFFLVN